MAGKKTGPKKHPGGRPTKYRPEFCNVVLAIGAKGGWLCEMAEACDVHRSTMDVWAEAHPEFSEALTRAKQKAQAWFERKGREGLTADKFNSALWAKQMSARHRDEYSERRELKHQLTDDTTTVFNVTIPGVTDLPGDKQTKEQDNERHDREEAPQAGKV